MKVYCGFSKVADESAKYDPEPDAFVLHVGPYIIEVSINELPKLVEESRNHLMLVTRPNYAAKGE